MPNTVLGKVSVTPKEGAWSSSSSYEKLDIVADSGNSYIALQNVPSGTALSNSSYWLMIAEKGDKGDKGDTGATGATGATGNGISSVEVEETSVVGSVHTYTLTISMTDGTSEVFTYEVTDGAVTSVNGKTGAVTGVAMDDGYYENMTVGGADQIISSVYVDDSVPYVFRTSGGTADIGDRDFEDAIVGGTIAFNQLVQNGNFADGTTGWLGGNATLSASNGVLAITPTQSFGNRASVQFPIIKGHKYLRSVEFLGTEGSAVISWYGAVVKSASFTGSWQLVADIIDNTYDNNNFWQLYCGSANNPNSSEYKIRNVMVIDLTQMFGSAIADYLYALEQANAGAGVAWFKSLFPKPYYAYNAGTLIHVNASAHETIGFNQWDEEWVNGYFNDSGVFTSRNDIVGSKNAIPVLPNTTYYLKCMNASFVTFWRSAVTTSSAPSSEFISRQQLSSAPYTFTTPSDCYYLFFNLPTGYGGTYKNDICLNLSWDGERDGEYEPYVKHTYALDDSLELRGIPKLDANNKLYYDGDRYTNDGQVERRYGIVDLGSLTWNDAFTNGFYARIETMKAPLTLDERKTGCVCVKYPNSTVISISTTMDDKSWLRGDNGNGYGYIAIKDTAYSDVTAFKTAMNGVMLVYELATPTTESAEPYTSPQIIDDFGTEQFVVVEQSGVAMPVGHESRYTNNLRAKLEMSPDSPDGDGDYIVRQENGENTYVPLVITSVLPSAPSTDGSYKLVCTIVNGEATYTWEAQA